MNKFHYAERGYEAVLSGAPGTSGTPGGAPGTATVRLLLCLHDFADFWYGFRHQLSGAAADGMGSNCWVVALDMKGTRLPNQYR